MLHAASTDLGAEEDTFMDQLITVLVPSGLKRSSLRKGFFPVETDGGSEGRGVGSVNLVRNILCNSGSSSSVNRKFSMGHSCTSLVSSQPTVDGG